MKSKSARRTDAANSVPSLQVAKCPHGVRFNKSGLAEYCDLCFDFPHSRYDNYRDDHWYAEQARSTHPVDPDSNFLGVPRAAREGCEAHVENILKADEQAVLEPSNITVSYRDITGWAGKGRRYFRVLVAPSSVSVVTKPIPNVRYLLNISPEKTSSDCAVRRRTDRHFRVLSEEERRRAALPTPRHTGWFLSCAAERILERDYTLWRDYHGLGKDNHEPTLKADPTRVLGTRIEVVDGDRVTVTTYETNTKRDRELRFNYRRRSYVECPLPCYGQDPTDEDALVGHDVQDPGPWMLSDTSPKRFRGVDGFIRTRLRKFPGLLKVASGPELLQLFPLIAPQIGRALDIKGADEHHKLSVKEIAHVIGKTPAWVRRRITGIIKVFVSQQINELETAGSQKFEIFAEHQGYIHPKGGTMEHTEQLEPQFGLLDVLLLAGVDPVELMKIVRETALQAALEVIERQKSAGKDPLEIANYFAEHRGVPQEFFQVGEPLAERALSDLISTRRDPLQCGR